MIITRKPEPADIDALAEVCLQALRAERMGDIQPSMSKIKAMVAMGSSGDEHFTRIVEVDGVVVGAFCVMVHEGIWFDGLQASLLINWVKVPGEGIKIIREFLRWAKDNPKIKLIAFSTDPDADPRLGKLLKRLGLDIVCPNYTQII